MKKQITRFAAGLLVAAMVVLLAACGSTDVPKLSQDPAEAAIPLASAGSPMITSFYTDVPPDAAYTEAVVWCHEQNLMGGTGNGLFEPDSVLDRRTMATVLYRAEGSPAVSGDLRFTDVEKGSWYSDAVVWADSSGIMSGYGNGIFGSRDAISQEMLKVIMDRYMGRGDTWIGDPALAAAATRAEIAVSLYENLRKDNGAVNSIILTVGGKSFDLELADTAAAKALRERLPFTVTMSELNGNEKFIYMDEAFPTDAQRPGIIQAGDLMLYGNNCIVLFYKTFSSSYSYTRLGHIQNPEGLEKAVGSGSAEVTIRETNSAAPTECSAPVVYMTTDISPDGLMKVYRSLNWTPTGKVAVKLSTGEPPASNYLDPDLIKNVVQAVDGTIVECNTAYGGSRASTAAHYQVAVDHGFTAIAEVDIMDEDGSMTLPVSGGDNLTENYVGSHFANYDSFLVLSHFKGHSMAGFGGAIKNISIGIASSKGKGHIHSGGTGGSMWGGDQDAFLESMAEAGKSVVDALNGKIVYISVMNRLSVDCDCNGHPSEPDMHDVGILASCDPVALDQACVDLVYAQKNGDGASLVRRIESRNGIHTLEQAEKIGLGSRTYSLVSIDG